MTENQKLKFELLKEFNCNENPVEFCREAYKFLTETEEDSNKDCCRCSERKDGIYLVYDTGVAQLFTKGLTKSYAEYVKYIGVVHEGHAFCVSLKSLGSYKLVKECTGSPSVHPLYIEKEVEALFDWECVERTKHIQEVGTDIPLKDGEYIPSLPMLVVMCHLKNKINEALEFVGGDILEDKNYWSDTECSATGAWNVYFSNGSVLNERKNNTYAIRSVAAFNF